MDTHSLQREFAVAPPTRNLRFVLVPVAALPMLIALVVIVMVGGKAPPPIPLVTTIGVAILFAGVFAMLDRAVQRRRIVLVDGTLEVTATIYSRKVPVSAFDLDQALMINLDEHKEWKPFIKSNGLGMPGLQAGWFRSRKLVRMFCLLTARHRVLVLPERDGGATILSADRPQQLLDALRETADASQRSR